MQVLLHTGRMTPAAIREESDSDDDLNISFGSFGVDEDDQPKAASAEAPSSPAVAAEPHRHTPGSPAAQGNTPTSQSPTEQAQQQDIQQSPPPPPKKVYSSWASMLGSSKPAAPAPPASPPMNGHPRPPPPGGDGGAQPAKGVDASSSASPSVALQQRNAGLEWERVLQMLSSMPPPLSPVMLDRRQRGLLNTGNACFRNVILQALLSCDSFYRLMAELQPAVKTGTAGLVRLESALPTWTQAARLSAAFEDPSLAAMVAYRKDPDDEGVVGKKKKKKGGEGQQGASAGGFGGLGKKGRELWLHAVKPDDWLGDLFGEFRSSEEGQQEDAQEFLHFFLDKLHNEVIAAAGKSGVNGGDGPGAYAQANGQHGAPHLSGDDVDDWQEIGKGGTRAVFNSTAITKLEDRFDSSVVTRMFYGRLRSDLRRSGSRNVSATTQRFDSLQLHIEEGKVTSLEDALSLYLSEETIMDAGSKVTKRMSFDLLPQVLVLQLKRFTFEVGRGAIKVTKPVNYPVTLRIAPHLMSATLRAQVGDNVRYGLFSVVLHYGRTVMGGHYTAYCKGQYPDEWYYYDDERVEQVGEAKVTSHKEEVYLLFYQRITD